MSTKHIFGIDLGTTYSCIAYVDEYNRPTVINNSGGYETTASVVLFETDNVAVGRTAKDAMDFDPDRVVSTVKRHMGTDLKYEFDGKTYRPQQVSAFILQKLVDDAHIATGIEVKDVVITCPAYFDAAQRQATKEAGELAGLDVHYVIPEPTAAAFAYGLTRDDQQNLLVYDLGGGTFDITVIEAGGGNVRVVCTGGAPKLGGADWDGALVEWLAQQFSEEHGIDVDTLLDNPETSARLHRDAEKLKQDLTSRTQVRYRVDHEGDRTKVELTREIFDQVTSHLLEQTIQLTRQTLDRARDKGVDRIDKILLVGGSTYMPQVKERLDAEFGLPSEQVDPNQIVAKGAALFGHKLALEDEVGRWVSEHFAGTGGEVPVDAGGTIDLDAVPDSIKEQAYDAIAAESGQNAGSIRSWVEPSVVNVSPKSFGLMVMTANDEQKVNNMVLIDDPVPADITRKFSTYADQQTGVVIQVHQNMQDLGEDHEIDLGVCTPLGDTTLEFGQALPIHSPLEVRFHLRRDGILEVFAVDLTTGRRIDAKFEAVGSLSSDEMKEAAQQHANMLPGTL